MVVDTSRLLAVAGHTAAMRPLFVRGAYHIMPYLKARLESLLLFVKGLNVSNSVIKSALVVCQPDEILLRFLQSILHEE